MKKTLSIAVLLATVALLASIPAGAATLEDRSNEWALSLSSIHQQDIVTNTTYGFQWSHIFRGGHIGLGVAASGFNVDFDDPSVPDENGSAVGPLFTWNWTPRFDRATGFLFATSQGTGGDLADSYDGYAAAGLGVKAFVGNSAAIFVTYTRSRFHGKDFVPDLDQESIDVAVAFYSHHRGH